MTAWIGAVLMLVQGDPQHVTIGKAEAPRYRRVARLVRLSQSWQAAGNMQRALEFAEAALADPEVPKEHAECRLILMDRTPPETVEFRLLSRRGEAALAYARTMWGAPSRDAARLARDSFVEAKRRGTPGLDGKIADAEALMAAPDPPTLPIRKAEPASAILPPLVLAIGVVIAALAVVIGRARAIKS